MVRVAPPAGRPGSTAAILPPRMATSRTASTPLRGSITCPPFKIRSKPCWEKASQENVSNATANFIGRTFCSLVQYITKG